MLFKRVLTWLDFCLIYSYNSLFIIIKYKSTSPLNQYRSTSDLACQQICVLFIFSLRQTRFGSDFTQISEQKNTSTKVTGRYIADEGGDVFCCELISWHQFQIGKGSDYGMDYKRPCWNCKKTCFSGTSTVKTGRGVIKNASEMDVSPWNILWYDRTFGYFSLFLNILS